MVVDDEDMRRGLHERELTRSPPARPRKSVTDCIAPPGRRKLRQSRSFPTKFLRHPPPSVRLVRATGGMLMRRSVKAILIARLFIGDLMMMTRTKILLAAGAAVLIGGVALAGTSFAERGFGHHGMRMGMMTASATSCCRTSTPTTTARCRKHEIDAAVNGALHRVRRQHRRKALAGGVPGARGRRSPSPIAVRAFQFLDPDGDAAIAKVELDRPLRLGRRPTSTRTPTACSRPPTGRITRPPARHAASRSGSGGPPSNCGAARATGRHRLTGGMSDIVAVIARPVPSTSIAKPPQSSAAPRRAAACRLPADDLAHQGRRPARRGGGGAAARSSSKARSARCSAPSRR